MKDIERSQIQPSTVAGQILLGNAWRLQPRGESQEQLPNRLPVLWIEGCRELKETAADAKTQTGGKKDKDISVQSNLPGDIFLESRVAIVKNK